MWALTRRGKAYRFTFSKSLAEHLQRWCGPENLRVERLAFRIGKPLQHGEVSRSGLYAITSTKHRDDNLVLRITMSVDIARLLTQDRWRTIYECWLVDPHSSKVEHQD